VMHRQTSQLTKQLMTRLALSRNTHIIHEHLLFCYTKIKSGRREYGNWLTTRCDWIPRAVPAASIGQCWQAAFPCARQIPLVSLRIALLEELLCCVRHHYRRTRRKPRGSPPRRVLDEDGVVVCHPHLSAMIRTAE
jgi:hypothetical protein